MTSLPRTRSPPSHLRHPAGAHLTLRCPQLLQPCALNSCSSLTRAACSGLLDGHMGLVGLRRYLAAPESLWMKQIGDILRVREQQNATVLRRALGHELHCNADPTLLQEKYPDRWLPKVGYMPYLLVWAAAPLVGMGRDFIQCARLADGLRSC